jgi:hypothetical protein
VSMNQWPRERANDWYDKRAWLVGCNFLPSSAVNAVEMWDAGSFDPETIDRELGWAEGIGLNSLRVFLQYAVWNEDHAGFLDRLDRFLDIADSHGMTTMPILFDDCTHAGYDLHTGKQAEPVPGIHNSRWVASPGKDIAEDDTNWPRLEQYVRDVVGRFAQDPRVLVWDLYNEPGNCAGLDPAKLLGAAFDWAQDVRPDQPLTAAPFAFDPEWEHELSRTMLERSDVISFHHYGGIGDSKKFIDNLRSFGRPILCTEWMARTFGSTFQTHLPMWKDEKVGCYCWGLVAGRTQTYFPWGSPEGSPEPELWFHDIFREDGSPFDPAEIDAIRNATTG